MRISRIRALARLAVAMAGMTLPAHAEDVLRIPEDASYRLQDGSVAQGGAEHVRFILERLNARFAERHPGISFTDIGKGTTSAVPLLTHGRIVFGSMGRGIDPLETAAYGRIVGAPPLEIRVAHTADDTSLHLATSLAVYVHRTNPLTRITREQLAQVMTVGNPRGDYSRWGQLGVAGPLGGRSIRRYGTPAYTGFGSSMQRDHYAGRALAPGYERSDNTDTILARLEQDPAGIAVAALGRETPNLRQLAVAPSAGEAYSLGSREDVGAGRYPLGRYLLFYVRKLPGRPIDPVAKAYLRLLLSPEGQAIVAAQDKGYIPLTPAEAAAEAAKLD